MISFAFKPTFYIRKKYIGFEVIEMYFYKGMLQKEAQSFLLVEQWFPFVSMPSSLVVTHSEGGQPLKTYLKALARIFFP